MTVYQNRYLIVPVSVYLPSLCLETWSSLDVELDMTTSFTCAVSTYNMIRTSIFAVNTWVTSIKTEQD